MDHSELPGGSGRSGGFKGAENDQFYVGYHVLCLRWRVCEKCSYSIAFLIILNYRAYLELQHLSCDMRLPTMWYVRPAKLHVSLRIRAV